MTMREFLVGAERDCPICGKTFIYYPTGGWVFLHKGRRTTTVFCSWGCMRRWEKKRSMSKIERREKIIQAIRDGLNDREIAILMDVDTSNVIYWRRKLEGEKKRDAEHSGNAVEQAVDGDGAQENHD